MSLSAALQSVGCTISMSLSSRRSGSGIGFKRREVASGGFVMLCQPLSEGLEQVDRLGGQGRVEPFGQLAVVHGGGEVVRRGSGAGVEPELDVDDELLAVATLLLEDAVMPDATQPANRQPVERSRWIQGASSWVASVLDSTGEA